MWLERSEQGRIFRREWGPGHIENVEQYRDLSMRVTQSERDFKRITRAAMLRIDYSGAMRK